MGCVECRPQTGGMCTVTWAGRCLKPFSLLYWMYWGIIENWGGSGSSLSLLCTCFYHFSGTTALLSSLSMCAGSWVSLDTTAAAGSSKPPSCLCTVTSLCPETADTLSHFSQFHLTLLSNHPDKPVSLSTYNHWISHPFDHTCLSVVQKDYVRLEFSTYFNKWMIAALYNLFVWLVQ